MRKIIYIIPFILIGCFAIDKVDSESFPIEHKEWSELLSIYVKDGKVNYKGFIQDSSKLNSYLEKIQRNHPNDKNWTKKEQLAYWINAYNAYTIQIVIRNYPVESIRDIAGVLPFVNSVWDQKFIKIENEVYDLNDIEHGIIRSQFQEPRIHFALVCASYSCPQLRNEAYEAEKLDFQLENQTKTFINDPTKNQIEKDKLIISKIFSWYSNDFDVAGGVRSFIKKYSETTFNNDVSINYKDYNWSLNE